MLEALYEAIRLNDAKTVEELIQKGLDVSHPKEGEFTPLISAVIYGAGDVFQTLVKQGAPINTMGPDGKTAFDFWAEFKDRNDPAQMRKMIDVLRAHDAQTGRTIIEWNNSLKTALLKADKEKYNELIAKGARFNFSEDENENSLIQAFKSGNSRFFKTILKDITNKDVNNPVVRPFLNYVVEHNQIKGIQEFLKAGGDIHFQDEAGETLLTKAVRAGLPEMTGALASLGVDLDLRDNQGMRPLDWALKQDLGEVFVVLLNAEYAKKGHLNISAPVTKAINEGYNNIIEELLKAEAPLVENNDASLLLMTLAPVKDDPTYIYSKEKVPLHRPVEIIKAGRKNIAESLIEAGSDLNQTDENGNTALLLAAKNGYPSLIPLMIQKGADIQAKNNQGLTALQVALSEGKIEAANVLVDAGADIHDGGENNFTPLMRAAIAKDVNFMKGLIEKGVDLNVQNSEGSTAVMMAAEYFDWPTIKCLLDAGADTSIKNNKGETFADMIKQVYSVIPEEHLPEVHAFFDGERAKKPKVPMLKQLANVFRRGH